MTQYIDKAAVVAEIESYRNNFCDRNGYLEDVETNGLAYDTLGELKDSIDTLEVKEVEEEPVSDDLEEAAYNFVMNNFGNPKELPYKFDQRCFKAGAQWQKKRVVDEITKYADHAHKMYDGTLEDKEAHDRSDEFYWDGFYDCADSIYTTITSVMDSEKRY